jgi:glycosyltransferase involved in cell wall biosynthesis
VVDANGNEAYFRNASSRVRRYLKSSRRETDVPAALAAADTALIPSLWHENTPLVAIEALANHRPVVASDQAGIRNIIAHGENGYLFRAGDPAAWAEGLVNIAKSRALLRAMRARCSYTMRAPEYVDTIDRAVGSGAR